MAALEQTLATFGIEYFTFQDFPDPHRYAEFVFCKRVPDEWLKLYIDEKYNLIDPAFRRCRRTNDPFIWADAPYDAEREPRTTEFVRRVADFGLANGLMIPIPRVTGRHGVVWFGGSAPEINDRTKPALHFLGLYAFERVRRLNWPHCEKHLALTLREREVLSWVAEGKTAWEIGEILNIAKRTVDEHTKTACRKLGAVNRAQAVAIAVRDRLISL